MSFVLDNSVVSGWFISEQACAYCESIAIRLQAVRAIAPPLLQLEYTNVMNTACKRQKMIAAQAHQIVAMLAELPIDIDNASLHPSQVQTLPFATI